MNENNRWGGKLPPRGQAVAYLLCAVANVTAQRTQRMADAERLADLIHLSPHMAWQLACTTAMALGYSSRTREVWKQVVNRALPGGFPSAEAWLQAAGLDEEGRDSGEARPDPAVDYGDDYVPF